MEDKRNQPPKQSPREVFITALKLGLTSFGGPTAHIGYFRDEYCSAAAEKMAQRAFVC